MWADSFAEKMPDMLPHVGGYRVCKYLENTRRLELSTASLLDSASRPEALICSPLTMCGTGKFSGIPWVIYLRSMKPRLPLAFPVLLLTFAASAQTRARDLGVP